MPLTFSGNNDTEVGLFMNLKHNEALDACVKSYNSCLDKINSPPGSDLDFIGPKLSKSLESSMDESNNACISEEFEEDSILETTALKHAPEPSKPSRNAVTTDNFLTVPGTIKRGKKKGQNVEVILNMSREELEILEANITNKKGFLCNTKNGVSFHILFWTILCFPVSIIMSGVYSFCIGTITWYNVFKHFSENKAVGYRILFPPLLIVLYPFLIISVSLGLGLYAGVRQLSCCWDSWLKEFTDYEKGFYGWLCNSLDIPECCPYEVVVLSGVQKR